MWDRGTYRNLTQREGTEVPLAEALDAGHASVWLEGEKIAGGYSLTRIGSSQKEKWLLVKRRDDAADARRNPTSTEPRSVVSGRTNSEVAEGAS